MRKTLLTTGALAALLIGPALAQDATYPAEEPAPAPEVMPAPGDDLTVGDEDLTPDVAAGPKFLEQQEETHLLASNLIGATVYNAADESLGDINDILFNEDDGSIEAVIVGVGGFLGIGQKAVAVSFAELTETTDADGNLKLVLDTTIEELEAAPTFVTLADLEMQQQQLEMQQSDPALAPAPAPEPMQ
jgi:sporulation protein YlmC with PRC-barrel domain